MLPSSNRANSKHHDFAAAVIVANFVELVERRFLAELRHTMLSRRSGEAAKSGRRLSTHYSRSPRRLKRLHFG